MNMDSKFAIPPQVMARMVGDETVILDLQSGTYFGLDPIGARIWTLIGEGKSLAEICDTVLAEYDVARDVLERDVRDLVHDLSKRKLIMAA